MFYFWDIPEYLQIAQVLLLFKSGKKNELSNYRHIDMLFKNISKSYL